MQVCSWSDRVDAAPIVGSLMQNEPEWTNAFTRNAIASYIQKIYHLMDTGGLSGRHALSSHGGEPAID